MGNLIENLAKELYNAHDTGEKPKRDKYVIFDKGRTFAARVYETHKLEFRPEE